MGTAIHACRAQSKNGSRKRSKAEPIYQPRRENRVQKKHMPEFPSILLSDRVASAQIGYGIVKMLSRSCQYQNCGLRSGKSGTALPTLLGRG